jgi:hypothetical protein
VCVIFRKCGVDECLSCTRRISLSANRHAFRAEQCPGSAVCRPSSTWSLSCQLELAWVLMTMPLFFFFFFSMRGKKNLAVCSRVHDAGAETSPVEKAKKSPLHVPRLQPRVQIAHDPYVYVVDLFFRLTWTWTHVVKHKGVVLASIIP